jgi:cysteine desulfurase family protein
MAIHGVLKPGDHVITTVYEHNSIIRPLMKLSKTGVEVTILEGNMRGEISFKKLIECIQPNTKMLATCIASNALGNIMPVEEIGRICREANILLLIDAAQGAGVLPINVEKMNIDLLAVPGHKSLYGPMGTGFLYIGERAIVDDIIQGGTGTLSEKIEQPQDFPTRYESGTINAVGIWGLNAGVNFVRKVGIDRIRKHEDRLTEFLIEGLSCIGGVKIMGEEMKERVPIVSFNIRDIHSMKVAKILDKRYDIATRGGLHCAGLFHKMADTLKQGAVRVSPGFFNTREEASKFLKAIRHIAKELK